jgi:hypothetical protein
MRRAAAVAVVLAIAFAATADAKPTCVVIHAGSHHALVHRVADALRAALTRSHSFVVGDGQSERSLHITVRYGAMRLPKNVPPFPHDHSTINVSFEYRKPGPQHPIDYEDGETLGLQCDAQAISQCVDPIMRTAYSLRHINHMVWETGMPPPTCMHELNPRCTSSAQ